VKEQIIQTLRELRQYALGKGCVVSILYQEENSALMRFANSAISLNTNEHLIRLSIDADVERRRASYSMITDLSHVDDIKQGVDTVIEMVRHAQPLNYEPTIPTFAADFIDETAFDQALAEITNAEKLAYFNQASAGLETDDLKLSGIFSSGTNVLALINTNSEHVQYFATTDAQINIVLSHATLKWEVTAEQSAQKKSDLDPAPMRRDLVWLVERYQTAPAEQIPVGKYDIVFGATAISDMISVMNWIGFSGGSMKRGFSFLGEDKLGQKVFSDKFSLTDDPTRLETYPFKQDFTGIERKPFPIFENGVFKSFTWYQDDADEFSAQATGHTVMHKSLVVGSGDKDVTTLEELAKMPRERDVLYIPFLHYMNLVNPSRGVITASSRFGALLLKKDGSIVVPFNVRVTQSLLEIFGEKVEWISKATTVCNTSSSYGARNPTALVVPNFIQVNDLEISHSNTSY
jgi:predicted Zn-dependent protease